MENMGGRQRISRKSFKLRTFRLTLIAGITSFTKFHQTKAYSILGQYMSGGAYA
jgi:hypothetical protein